MAPELLVRRLEGRLERLVEEEPVIALHGPRSVGKSTLLRSVARTIGAQYVDLDDPGTRQAVASDPSLFASGGAPVCIDEYQHVPELLDAIKAELNRDLRPGRFLLAGSTRFDSLPAQAQALTGRLHRAEVLPLSQVEIDGTAADFARTLLAGPARLVTSERSSTSRADYVARVVRGGMPLAVVRRAGEARERWFADYVDLVLERDVLDLSRIRQRAAMPRLMSRLAGQTTQVLNIGAAADAVGLERSTAESYTKLLEAVYLVRRLPAWGTTLRSRMASTPKVHVVDSGVAAFLAGTTAERVEARSPQALTEFGHLLETFCVGEILTQIGWSGARVQSGHMRSRDGDEIALVLEARDGTVTAVEIKASGRVTGADQNAMGRLRDRIGSHFAGGVTLYLGERSYTFADRFARGSGRPALVPDELT